MDATKYSQAFKKSSIFLGLFIDLLLQNTVDCKSSSIDQHHNYEWQETPAPLPGQQGARRGGQTKQVAEGASPGDQQGRRQGPNRGEDQHYGEGS